MRNQKNGTSGAYKRDVRNADVFSPGRSFSSPEAALLLVSTKNHDEVVSTWCIWKGYMKYFGTRSRVLVLTKRSAASEDDNVILIFRAYPQDPWEDPIPALSLPQARSIVGSGDENAGQFIDLRSDTDIL